MYLFRAVDSYCQTVDFYLSETPTYSCKALANADDRPPYVFATDGLRSYPDAIRG